MTRASGGGVRSSGAVVVVGSINADVVVAVADLPPAGATVLGRSADVLPGGKGLNQAVAASRAGAADVRLVGCIGDDEWGDRLDAFLAETEIDRRFVGRVGQPTGVAVVTVSDDGENHIVVVPGANRSDRFDDVTTEAMAQVSAGDVVVAQLEIQPTVVASTLERARHEGATTVLNPSPASEISPACLEHADVVVLNEHEAAELGLPGRRRAGQHVVITRGAGGLDVVDDQGTRRFAARPARAVDSTGAGDCFTGVLAAGLAAGASIDDSIRRAVIAASLQVERLGAAPAMPTAEEIDAG